MSVSRNDFVPFKFRPPGTSTGSQTVHSVQKGWELGRTAPRPFEYPVVGQDSSSLRLRTNLEPLPVERTQPAKKKQDLMKSGFEIGKAELFTKHSMYGATFTDPTKGDNSMSAIQFKYKPRNFDIITNSKRPAAEVPGGMPHHKYEFYDPEMTRHRHSFNKTNMRQVNPRLDPITGREIAGPH